MTGRARGAPVQARGAAVGTRAGPVEAIVLPDPIRAAIVEHCRRELPNEACGLIAGDAPFARGGQAARWLPARNAHASPYRYELDPDDLVRLTLEIDDAGQVVWAVVHSHVSGPAVPSPTDVREWRYPDALQVVVAMSPGAQVRAWRLSDGAVIEIPVAP